jgi:deltex-like protein
MLEAHNEIIVVYQRLERLENNLRQWISFPQHCSQSIEHAFKDGSINTIRIDINESESVSIDFTSMRDERNAPIRRKSNKHVPDVRWEYAEDRHYIDYSTDQCEQISLAADGGRPSTVLYMGSGNEEVEYLIDIVNLVQIRCSTGFRRTIHKVPTAAPRGSQRNILIDNILDVAIAVTIPEEETCAICLDHFTNSTSMEVNNASNAYRLHQCMGHYFHKACIKQQLERKGKCAVCSYMYIITEGSQPRNGTMDVSTLPPGDLPLQNLEAHGTIVIEYNFPSGIQGPEHPHPGIPYYGTYRTAFLPDNSEGRDVLVLLRRCFELRHTFSVGRSLTTGRDNCIVWNGIHHKTAPRGGTSNFGWPDETYFMRVKDELKARGIE